ncbi:hypothetical protein ASE00_13420 [Sphingomonas sp. Root710]|uniref:hypothetical protein n=1 Tax=Sphingomonas sp. Root710 TaxID=1736594 RepID=UPI0006F63A9E|nr:hypothetical protein [Sphingomonas sp. Root710]KRB82985.1 hypothetical protein ASE00_13420 [Sphingomonas sp. Root710]
MHDSEIAEIARLLLAARIAGRQVDPPPVATHEDAYTIQTEIARRDGGFGYWKLAAPGDGLFFSPIRPAMVGQNGIRFPEGTFVRIGIEGEIVVTLGGAFAETALTGGDITRHVEKVHAGIEIVDTRIAGWPHVPRAPVIADSMLSGALAIGDQLERWQEMDLVAPGFSIEVNGQVKAAPQPNNVGNIFAALGKMLAHIRSLDIDLPDRIQVTTGSATGLIFAEPGDHIALKSAGRQVAEVRV